MREMMKLYLEEIEAGLPATEWSVTRLEDGSAHYTGRGPKWVITLIDFGGTVAGAASNALTVMKLTDPLAALAVTSARAATTK